VSKQFILKKELRERDRLATNKLDQVTKELRGFTSLHGFSTVLETSSPFVKGLWVFFFLVLFSFLLQNALENIDDFNQYTVITKIENAYDYPMKLPAVTLCLAGLYPNLATNATLAESLFNCTIAGNLCDKNDFYSFETRPSFSLQFSLTCYVLNGGRNSTGHSREIKSTRNTGSNSGVELIFFLPKKHIFFYFINDAFVKPTTSEIIKMISAGTTNHFILEKIVEKKLEYPFNNCWDRNNLPDTPLVRNLSRSNITYRQLNCFELCFQNYIQDYALEHNITEDDARGKEEVKSYDREKNCDHLCPLECESTEYKIFESKPPLADITDVKEYSLELIPQIKKKLNITVNSTDDFDKSLLEIYVFFSDLKYTKISQTPKTTLSSLISNLGGSTGLFLDLSFMSACRAIEFILGIFFKF